MFFGTGLGLFLALVTVAVAGAGTLKALQKFFVWLVQLVRHNLREISSQLAART